LPENQIQAKNLYLYHFFPETICFAGISYFTTHHRFSLEVCSTAEGVLVQGTNSSQTMAAHPVAPSSSSPQHIAHSPPPQGKAGTETQRSPRQGQPRSDTSLQGHGRFGFRNTCTHL